MSAEGRWGAVRSAAALTVLVGGLALALGPGAERGQSRLLGRVHRTVATFSVSHYTPDIPWDGPISTIDVRPGDDSDILVASDSLVGNGTIFSSHDAGTTWTHDDNFPGSRVQAVTYDDYDLGLWRCSCILATTAPDFQASGGGGLWETNSFSPPRTWHQIPGVFPAPGGGCPADPAAHDISISPVAPHTVYIGTDCGIAIVTPHGADAAPTITTKPVTGPAIPAVASLLALAGGNLVVAGPATGTGNTGVWHSSDGGDHWTQSQIVVGSTTSPFDDTVGNDLGQNFVHAFAADPRGGNPNRAYVVAADAGGNLHLFETTDGGITWHPVPISLGNVNGGCGGMPTVHAVVQSDNRLHLYVGDRCHIYKADLPLDQEPYQNLSIDSWSMLAQTHDDTRDVAFHSGTNLPLLEASDGGLARSTNGGDSFEAIRPTSGLNALQITEITGQVPAGRATPDLYFATWHDALWSMQGTSPASFDSRTWEGMDLGMPAYAPATNNQVTLTTCSYCHNYIAGPHFAGSDLFPDAERTTVPDPVTGAPVPVPISNPIFVRPREYAQQVDSNYSGGAGFALTGDSGSTWHRIASVDGNQVRSWLQPVGPSANPTLFFVDYLGTDGSANQWDVLGLATIKNLSLTAPPVGHAACAASDDNCLTFQTMSNFGSLGLTTTDMASYPVYAVDPANPNRLIAADVGNGDVQSSDTEGSSWNEIHGLGDLLTAHGRYAFARPTRPGSQDRSPNASVISICPQNDKRVLIGTHLGGAYFSFNGGSTWTPVSNSDQIVYATSIYWLPGCGSAYVGTYGRGIFRIDMQVHTEVVRPPSATGPHRLCTGRAEDPAICRLEDELSHRLRRPHPLPSAARGIVVLDGFIQHVRSAPAGPQITVSAGSIVTAYKDLPHGTKIRYAMTRPTTRGTEAVFFVKRELVRTLKGTELSLYHLARGHTGKGLATAPPLPDVRIQILGYPGLYGDSFPILPAGAQLALDVTFAKASTGKVVLDVDGGEVAKYPAGQKLINYAAKFALPPGQHTVSLLEETAKGLTPVASEPFAVANGDEGK